MTIPNFIPGLKLSEEFYNSIIFPILSEHFPHMKYSAGLLGYGSEIIGFDTFQSTDHMWGPRLYIFLNEEDYRVFHKKLYSTIIEKLPYTFKGYSVNFTKPDSNDGGVQTPDYQSSGKINPLIWITTISRFFKEYLNIGPYTEINFKTWITFSEHRLLAVTSGKIFYDDLNLKKIQNKFHYYPEEVWLYMLASQWSKIAQIEAFPGRCHSVDDNLGLQIILSRLIRHLMYLCFLMEKQYSTYDKWFGSAFKKLKIADKLLPIFKDCLSANSWNKQEELLCEAYRIIAQNHNSLNITKKIDSNIRTYFGRPYKVIFASRFVEAIDKIIKIKYPNISNRYIGSISQFSDTPDLYDNSIISDKIKTLY